MKRISLASSLYRMAMTGLIDGRARGEGPAARSRYLDHSVPTPELNALMES